MRRKRECDKRQPLNQSNRTYVVPVEGAKGDPLTWDDLTEEQKLSLKGEQGDTGTKGDDGVTPIFRANLTTNHWEVSYDQGVTYGDLGVPYQGVKGDKGDPLTYSEWSPEDVNKLIEDVNINAQRVPAITAGELPTPSQPNSYMVVTGVGDYTYGGATIGTNSDGYQTTFWWDGTAWSNNGSVKIKGNPGVDGKTILNGTGAPEAGLGNIGDFYFDIASQIFYGAKTAEGWGNGFNLGDNEKVLALWNNSSGDVAEVEILQSSFTPYPTNADYLISGKVQVYAGKKVTFYFHAPNTWAPAKFYNSLEDAGTVITSIKSTGAVETLQVKEYIPLVDGYVDLYTHKDYLGAKIVVKTPFGKIYLTPDDLGDSVAKQNDLEKLFKNDRYFGDEEAPESETVLKSSAFVNNFSSLGYKATSNIELRKGDSIEMSVFTAYQVANIFVGGVKTGEVVGNGNATVLTTKSYIATQDVQMQVISLLSGAGVVVGDIEVKITRPETLKIYLTPEDLTDITSNLFDVGNKFNLPKPATRMIVDVKLNAGQTLPSSKADGFRYGIATITSGNLSFKKYVSIEVQGTSSQVYPKKNFTFALYNDEEYTDEFKLAIDNSVYLNEWVYKANWIDATNYRNIVANRLWKQFEQARSGAFKREIDLTYKDKTGFESFDTGATGVVDGYPCEVVVNDSFYGIGTFNMGKKRDNYNLVKNNQAHTQIETGVRQMDFYSMTLANEDYEYRNPGTPDATNEAKIQSFKTFAALAQANFTADLQGANPTLNKRNLIDYIIFVQALFLPDNLGNNIMLTSWGNELFFMPYDLDNAFGLRWDGTVIWSTNLNVFDSKSDLPANTKQFWHKCKTALAPDLAFRYAELKAKGVLTVDNIYKLCTDLEVLFSQSKYKEEQEKWTTIPSKTLTNKQQITSWFTNRLIWLDSYFV